MTQSEAQAKWFKPDSSWRISPILEQFKLNLNGLLNCCFELAFWCNKISQLWDPIHKLRSLGNHLVEAYLKPFLRDSWTWLQLMWVTTLCWWLYNSNWFKILIAKSLCWWLFQWKKSVTNILTVSNIRHQHQCSHETKSYSHDCRIDCIELSLSFEHDPAAFSHLPVSIL